MAFKNIKYSLIFLFIVFTSCQEKYDPNDIVSDKFIPVINGSITDNGAPWVKLSWASAYNKSKAFALTRAKVYIFDDVGNKILLEEKSKGAYYSSILGLTGTIGRTYVLHVELPDKRVFESVSERMTGFSMKDSIYASIGTYVDPSNLNSYGDILIQPLPVLNIHTNIVADTVISVYSRIAVELATETTFSLVDYTEYYISKSELYDNPNIIATNYFNSKQEIKNHYLGYLLFGHDTIKGAPLHLFAFIITTNYYSISSATYKYYQSIVNQLDANGRMFDPVPSQLKGNIRCISDSSQLVLGNFEVNAKILTTQDAFYWDFKSDHFKHKRIDPVINFPNDSISPLPFWDDF